MPPKAFISYSWDDSDHEAWVEKLAERLQRDDGVAVTLDKWHVHPGDDVPAFMETSIRDNDYVLIVCTPHYRTKSNARTGGAGYEGSIITGELVTGTNRRKFIPLLRRGTWKEAAPTYSLSAKYLDFSGEPYSEKFYRELTDTLHGIRKPPPPLGAAPHSSSPPPTPPTTTGSGARTKREEFEEALARLKAKLTASRMPTGQIEVVLADGVWQRPPKGPATKWPDTRVLLAPTLDDVDGFGVIICGPFYQNGIGKKIPYGTIKDVLVEQLPRLSLGLHLDRRVVTKGPDNHDIDFEHIT